MLKRFDSSDRSFDDSGHFVIGQSFQKLERDNLLLFGGQMSQGFPKLFGHYGLIGHRFQSISGHFQGLFQGEVLPVLLAAVMVNDEIMGYTIQPGSQVTLWSGVGLKGLQKTLEYDGR